MERIQKWGAYYLEEVIRLRQHFHQFPELSGAEFKTADKICEVLEKLNIPYTRHIAGEGIIALLTGDLPGTRTVALRADMDALPIQEENEVPYKSQNPQVMHACGHDVHIASLLGALMVLKKVQNSFGGTIKAIFQPSEEQYPGGALGMINENVLSNPEVDTIFAQHATPGIEVGCIGIRDGRFMASTDEIHITVTGKGGHAAMPHEYISPLKVGMELLREIEANVSKNQPKEIPTILAFGKFIANGLTNLIPNTAEIAGTLRTFDETWRDEAHQIIHKTAAQISQQSGASCSVIINKGYPVLINDSETTERVKKYAISLLGAEHVLSIPERMTAEDFAYFLQKKPGVFYRLGTSNNSKGITNQLHTSRFDIDEQALQVGMMMLSWIALNELKIQ